MIGKRRTSGESSADLNVVPVMNLFMVLIPFLLLGAAFYHIGVIPTSTPQNSPHESDVPKTPVTVAASLYLEKEEMRVTFESTSLSQEERDAIAAAWPRKGKSYNAKALQKHLLDIKRLYPKSTTITILPYDGLDYQSLVEVLDKVREYDTGKLDKEGNPKFAELFPVTVFSRLLIAPPSEEGGEESAEGGDEDGGGEE